LTLTGQRAEEIPATLGVHISTVHNWRGYFAHGGVMGLRRRTAPGRQATIGPHAGAIAVAIRNEDTGHDLRATIAAGRWGGCVPRLPGVAGRRSRRAGCRTNCAKGVCLPSPAPHPQRPTGRSGGRGQPRAPCRFENPGPV
jgi:hypothetical protein